MPCPGHLIEFARFGESCDRIFGRIIRMEIWIALTIGAAFLQNLRSVAQKQLKGKMGTTGATFARFGFGLPFAVLFLLVLHYGRGDPLPVPGAAFAFWALIGGVAQIAATFLLVYLFSFRNFAVGTAYSRTEPAQAALFALVFLSETVDLAVILAIAISVVGVMLISVAHVKVSPRSLITSMGSRTAVIGLVSGSFFGVSAVAYRAASTSLGGPNFIMQASVTLAFVLAFQTVAMLAWMAWRERDEIGRVMRAWRLSLFTGAVGASASFGWFMAMTLQQAAIVKAVGQIEMLFTMLSTVFFFRERILPLELVGCGLIVAGILGLLFAG